MSPKILVRRPSTDQAALLLLLLASACRGALLDVGPQDAGPASDALGGPQCTTLVVDVPDGGDASGSPAEATCLCTRRPGPTEAVECPRGVNETASATIGPSGGTVTIEGQQGIVSGVPFSLRVPPGAVASDTTITVTETAMAPPDGFADWSPVYRIDPIDLILSEPASLTIPFSNASGVSVSAGPTGAAPGSSATAASLAVFWSSSSDPCTLAPLSSSYVNAGFMQATVSQGGYAIVGEVGSGACSGIPADASAYSSDATTDASADASTSDTGGDASAEAESCPSIQEACADAGARGSLSFIGGFSCVAEWSIATQPSTWCSKFPYAELAYATDCEGFDIAVVGATDTSVFYYYDPQSGALVGIEARGEIEQGHQRLGGQAPDVQLTECVDAAEPVRFYCESDGGVSDSP